MLMRDDEKYSSSTRGSFSLAKIILGILALLFLTTFIPGAPKGIIIGHEFGNSETELRLQLPITRPISVQQGDIVTARYWVRAPQGFFSLYERHAAMLLGFGSFPRPTLVTNIAMTTSGSVRHTIRNSGLSFYTFAGRPVSSNAKGCENRFSDLWDAMTAYQGACPVFNGSYVVLLYLN